MDSISFMNTLRNKTFQFNSMPKYDCITQIIKPKLIGPLSNIRNKHSFNLLNAIENNTLEIQLRFSYITDFNNKPQIDRTVNNLCIDINGIEFYRHSKTPDLTSPFNITNLCKYNATNNIDIWINEVQEWELPCLIEVSHVRKNTPEMFLEIIMKDKNNILDKEYTKLLLKKKFSLKNDDDMRSQLQHCIVSLECPISKTRLINPCRTVKCQHIECFDAISFFQINDKKSQTLWKCPICSESASINFLRIDGLIMEVLLVYNRKVKFRSDGTHEEVTEYENVIDLENLNENEESLTKYDPNFFEIISDDIEVNESNDLKCCGMFGENLDTIYHIMLQMSEYRGKSLKSLSKPTQKNARAFRAFKAKKDNELSLKEGDQIKVISKVIEKDGWSLGEINGFVGIFPDNSVEFFINDDEPELSHGVSDYGDGDIQVISDFRPETSVGNSNNKRILKRKTQKRNTNDNLIILGDDEPLPSLNITRLNDQIPDMIDLCSDESDHEYDYYDADKESDHHDEHDEHDDDDDDDDDDDTCIISSLSLLFSDERSNHDDESNNKEMTM